MFLNFRPLGAGCGAPVDDQNQVWLFLPGNPLGKRESFPDFSGQVSPFDNGVAAAAEFDPQPGSKPSSPAIGFRLQPGPNFLNRFPCQFFFFAQPEWLSFRVFPLDPEWEGLGGRRAGFLGSSPFHHPVPPGKGEIVIFVTL